MNSLNLTQWIKDPRQLNATSLYELRNLVARYPYFQTARLLFLQNLYLLHDATFGAELRRSSLFVADRVELFNQLEGALYRLTPVSILPEQDEIAGDRLDVSDRTLTLINAFLASQSEEQSEAAELDAPNDYTAFLLEDTQNAQTEGGTEEEPHDLPKQKKKAAGPVLPKESEELDDSYFTETLAKIYIRQRRYSKALEIIRKLSLAYPEKNVYFADQIRLLEKLIEDEK